MNGREDNWAIVGGGLLGMTLALRLAQAGKRVTLFEAAPHVGGLADAWQLGDITWDRHYHVTLLSDAHLRKLLAELDLDREMQWVETKTGFYVDGKLYSLSNSWEFLRFPPLSLIDKFRLGLTIFCGARRKDWQALENIPVADWLRKWSGRRTFEKIWLPLLRSKLGESYRETSAAFIWATIARMYAARRTGLKKELFGYLPGGYARTLSAFAERLNAAGVEVRTSSPVVSVERGEAGAYEVIVAGKEAEAFDRVVVTVAPPLAGRICEALSDDEREKLSAVRYQGIVCASLLLDESLSPYYVTNITADNVPFTAVIEMSSLVERGQFGGKSLVYLPKYVAPDDPLFQESDDSIRARFLDALAQMHPTFSPDKVRAFRVSRVKHVFPLSTLGYSRTVAPTVTSQPGLYLVNSAQIVNGTLNVNETVKLAEEALPILLSSLRIPHSALATSPHAAQTC